MSQHRDQRVSRWQALAQEGPSSAPSAGASEGELRRAVTQLYGALDELQDLKVLADDYQWDEMQERLRPSSPVAADAVRATEPGRALPAALECSLDTLRSARYTSARGNVEDMPELVGFDWGSCAWRHCGAKADAQEALAELRNGLGLLEPYECRFVIGEHHLLCFPVCLLVVFR